MISTNFTIGANNIVITISITTSSIINNLLQIILCTLYAIIIKHINFDLSITS